MKIYFNSLVYYIINNILCQLKKGIIAFVHILNLLGLYTFMPVGDII